jgi:hypothetical protein
VQLKACQGICSSKIFLWIITDICALYIDTGLSTDYSGSTVYHEDGDRMLFRKASKYLPQQIAAATTATHVLHRDVCKLPDRASKH